MASKKRKLPSRYKNYLSSYYWHEVKRAVKLRDRFTCQDCGRRSDIEVHHLTYENRGREMEHLGDLVCLCERCHEKRHKIKTRKKRVA